MRSTDAALRAVGLQASLDGVEESEGGSAVEDAVVEGDFEVHHAADGDGVVEDDGAFDYGFGGEDGRLRVIDNGRRDHASERARVIDGEGAARDVFRAEFSGAGALYEVVYPAGQAGDVQLVGVGDDGYDQGVFQVDGHADVHALPEDDAVPIPHGVEHGIFLEALDDGLHDERQVGELHALAFHESGLLPLTQRDEPTHVHLDHRPCVRGLALAGGHAVRDGPPDAREVLDAVALEDRNPFRLGFRGGLWGCDPLWDRLPGRRFAFRPAFLYVTLDVLPGYASSRAGAGDVRYLHVVFLGEAPDHRRGARQAQRFGVFHLTTPAAPASRRERRRTPSVRRRLGLGCGGGELFCGGGVGDVLLRRGVGGGRILLGGDQRDLGSHVDRGALRDEELLDLASHGGG